MPKVAANEDCNPRIAEDEIWEAGKVARMTLPAQALPG